MSGGPKLTVFLGRDEIASTVKRLAGQIKADYSTTQPLFVAVLKGSFIFMADLVRALDMPVCIEFVCLASYGAGTESSGNVTMYQEPRVPVEGRHVVVVDDIIDTGLTTNFLIDYLRARKPASLRLCALADKPQRRKAPVTIDYLGFTVPDRFLVGYGLDWDEKYRNLPDICVLEF